MRIKFTLHLSCAVDSPSPVPSRRMRQVVFFTDSFVLVLCSRLGVNGIPGSVAFLSRTKTPLEHLPPIWAVSGNLTDSGVFF